MTFGASGLSPEDSSVLEVSGEVELSCFTGVSSFVECGVTLVDFVPDAANTQHDKIR